MAAPHCALLSRTYSPLFLGQRDEQRLQRGAAGTSGREAMGSASPQKYKIIWIFGKATKSCGYTSSDVKDFELP